MKVISMVPSWTETLIESCVNVVGRTRFCIHPKVKTGSIPVLGGTKDIHWDRVKALKADLLVLDKEENPLWMAEESPIPYIASHVKCVSDVSRDLQMLAQTLENKVLVKIAEGWRQVAKSKPHVRGLGEIPGIVEWINPPTPKLRSLVYLIWKNPWMAVSQNTFIGSMMQALGLSSALTHFEEPYPKINLESFDPASTLLLFSTEPFPFLKKVQELKALPFSSAIIDGEAYSWFGLRSLKFLEQNIR